MLTRMRLKNFKAWKDSGDIRLAPITVLFGANSAGKTSIPQLLLLLKQTAESPDRQRALNLGDSRTPVDAGTFDDIAHGHNVEHAVEFELEWSIPTMVVVDHETGSRYNGNRIQFSAKIGADEEHQPKTISFSYSLRRGGNNILSLSLSEHAGSRERREREFDITSAGYKLVRWPGRRWRLPAPSRFYGFPSEVSAHYKNAGIVSNLVLALERELRSIYYVGPLREHPKRLYFWSGGIPDHVGVRGDRAIEAILAGQQRSFNWKSKQRTLRLPELVAKRLKSMGLIHSFRVVPIGEHRKEYEVFVRAHSELPEVKLTDVGFGVSQVMPVIVECFYVPRRSIVIFEQPEIHLHPRVQAELADLFIEAIRAREGNAPRNCQFIIESHSEHFLRRLQRRIAEEGLSKDDAAFYFVDANGPSATIQELDVDDYGNIRNWPDGFFGDEMEDLLARNEAQARRMKAKGGKK